MQAYGAIQRFGLIRSSYEQRHLASPALVERFTDEVGAIKAGRVHATTSERATVVEHGADGRWEVKEFPKGTSAGRGEELLVVDGAPVAAFDQTGRDVATTGVRVVLEAPIDVRLVDGPTWRNLRVGRGGRAVDDMPQVGGMVLGRDAALREGTARARQSGSFIAIEPVGIGTSARDGASVAYRFRDMGPDGGAATRFVSDLRAHVPGGFDQRLQVIGPDGTKLTPIADEQIKATAGLVALAGIPIVGTTIAHYAADPQDRVGPRDH